MNTETSHTKQVGKYKIIADSKPELQKYTTPEGNILQKSDLWKGDVFYEQDYFGFFAVKNLCVIDGEGNVCTPIIKEIEVKNEGYVMTFRCTFWVQGYAVIKDKIYFVGIGEDDCMYSKKPVFFKIKDGIELNTSVKYNDFINNMIEPVNPDEEGISDLIGWGEGKNQLSELMLCE
ncbi:MAG: hypothetical protein AB9882_08665 [Ignavibacteriaceae bacterium]